LFIDSGDLILNNPKKDRPKNIISREIISIIFFIYTPFRENDFAWAGKYIKTDCLVGAADKILYLMVDVFVRIISIVQGVSIRTK
jgi:hypothetical protein